MQLRTKAKFTDEITSLELANKELSYQAATEGIVLLENKGVLPLSAGKIALYGAGAAKTIKGGTGSGEVIERHAVSIREGMKNRGFEIVTERWLERYDALWEQEREVFIAGMRRKLKKFNTEMLAEMLAADYRYPYGDAIRESDLSDETDICVYVLSRQSGEGSDRRQEDFRLSDTERAHLQVCAEHYKHIILIVNTGASFDISFVKDFSAIKAVVFACQLGQEAGNALADVLIGKVNPSGKLAATWARSYEDIPFADEYSYMGKDLNHAAYSEGIYVGYRYYDSFGVEPGDYILRVGNSSRNTVVCAVAELTETVTVSTHRNLCVAKEPVQKLHRESKPEAVDAERITVDAAAFQTNIIDYAEVCPEENLKVTDMLRKLSVQEQIKFCAGIGLLGGETGFTLPGAVGNTTSEFWKLGIPNATFCDGPAGIRIQRRSTVTKKGAVKPVDGAISIYEYLPTFLQKLMYGNPAKEKMIYQYVTSFPVATAMAQTWNLPLMEKIGQAVSKEMTEYGVVFWLAPALNIIRNPLCGRNYEYYSEDPLVSGKMSAAVTRGVQATPGNYVTIKHYAANNQEENRYYVSSDMDERTLREIYLRGFEIAVKEAKPKALMTAYNRINDVYCPANPELVDMILRREWDFDGIVMTDWLSTGEDRAQNVECIASGTDLIMPGGKGVWKELAKANKDGRLSADDVRRAAYNVLKLVLNSQIKTK